MKNQIIFTLYSGKRMALPASAIKQILEVEKDKVKVYTHTGKNNAIWFEVNLPFDIVAAMTKVNAPGERS